MTSFFIKAENPWDIRSMYDLQFYHCPDCIYINQSKQEFVNHAYESHPKSIDYLNNIEDDSLNDVNCPWDLNNIETKQESLENNVQTKIEPEDYFDNESEPLIENTSIDTGSNGDEIEHFLNDSKTSCDESETIKDENKIEAKCKICEKVFYSKQTLKKHINHVHEGFSENHKCEICGKVFPYKYNWVRHLKIMHNKTVDKIKKIPKCKHCDKIFSRPGLLKKHILTAHEGVKPFKCDKCNKMFTNFDALKRHNDSFHLGIKHMCHLCGKSFKCANYVKQHVRTFHEGLNLKCDICGKTFSSEDNLKTHNCNGGLEFKCEYSQCNGKIWKSKGELNKHVSIVHDKKICTICGKLIVAHYLKQHMIATHNMKSEKQDLKCEICKKEFARPYLLKKHMNTHTGIKPYKCQYCGQSFADSSNKRNHEKSVHEGIKRSHEIKVNSVGTPYI